MATTTGTDGQEAKLQVDASGALRTTGVNSTVSAAPVLYRNAVVAADVMAIPGTVTCTKLSGVGALTAGAYVVVVAATNAHGRTTGKNGNTAVTTETTNLGVRAAFAQVTGATHYDIYCSVAAAGAALWVGRITEAQRASGIVIDAVGSTAAGGTAGAVDIYAIGTGLAANASNAVNYAYVMPATPVVCTGKQYVDFEVTASRTGDAVAMALIVAPFFLNSRLTQYAMGTPVTMSFGGAAGQYNSMIQRLRVPVHGEEAVHLVVLSIAGTGASVAMDYILS
jgi:hypothetical protein